MHAPDEFLSHTTRKLADSGYGLTIDEADPALLVERSGRAVRAASLMLLARLATDLGGDDAEQGLESVLSGLGGFAEVLRTPSDATGTDFLRVAWARLPRPVYDVLLMTGLLLARLGVAFAEANKVPWDDGVLTVMAAGAAGRAFDEAGAAEPDAVAFIVRVFRGAERLANDMATDEPRA